MMMMARKTTTTQNDLYRTHTQSSLFRTFFPRVDRRREIPFRPSECHPKSSSRRNSNLDIIGVTTTLLREWMIESPIIAATDLCFQITSSRRTIYLPEQFFRLLLITYYTASEIYFDRG
mmetsp:Transcript_46574/g.52575  ORF Transcript_46574/g.52575 Transcript_46574/m.52575 type:complete len:119 (+) Transcript_46574:787-1143(+)